MHARFAVLVLAVAACGSDQSGPGGGGARLSVINAAGASGSVKVYVDGAFAGSVDAARQGAAIDLDPGQHTLDVRHADGSAGFSRPVNVSRSLAMTVVAYDSLGLLRPGVLEDTNSVVPAGASKLRVAHFAASAGAIDIWRTQPDFATPVRVMFPFELGDVSPYIQSTPGAWRVLVSTAIHTPNGPMPDTLAMTGDVAVGDGEARTVVVVDAAGGGVKAIVAEQ